MTSFFEWAFDSGVKIIITIGRFWIMSNSTVKTIRKRRAKLMELTRWLDANLVQRYCDPQISNDTFRGLENGRRNMPRTILAFREGHKSISELD